MKRCWDWGEDGCRGVCFCCWLCPDVPFRAQLSTSGPSWEKKGCRLTAQKWDSCFKSSDYPGISALPGWRMLYTSGFTKNKSKKGEGICHSPSWRKHRNPWQRRIQEKDTYWVCEIVPNRQAHRLSRNLKPEQPGWLCGIHFMWNTLQPVPFRTIIAFLRTIMYYVWCIIYSGGYWFIKELWANCQVIIWTVVMSYNKGYNLHSYSVFKLMSYPVWNPALGVLFLWFLIFENTAWF